VFASRSALVWTLRIGAFLCFVGHGAFGIMTKRAWLPYFAVADVGPDLAFRLMPLIGTVDIVVGILALICPIPAIGIWMSLWAIWTAVLRPLAGESAWEAFERAGNYGVPLALLLLVERRRDIAGFFSRGQPRNLDTDLLRRLRTALTIAIVFLLVGHGMLGVAGKPGQVENYASLFAQPTAVAVTRIAGGFEILLAAIVVVRPSVGLLVLVAAWKLGTESLFLSAGASPWEVVERGGSYAAPIALAIVTTLQARSRLTSGHRAPASSRSSSAEILQQRTIAAPFHSARL
jgi:hypothetical protein